MSSQLPAVRHYSPGRTFTHIDHYTLAVKPKKYATPKIGVGVNSHSLPDSNPIEAQDWGTTIDLPRFFKTAVGTQKGIQYSRSSRNRHPTSRPHRIGNVLPVRGLTFPPDHCRGTPVIWRTRTSSARIAVLDPQIRPTAPPDSRPRPTRAGKHADRTHPRAQLGPAGALHRRGPAGGGLSFRLARHSHSMVPGGLLVQSSTTRLTSGTELVIRLEMRARTS